MKKLIALGLMVCSANVAFAADGSYTGTIDMTMSNTNQVDVERANSKLTLKGRNEAMYGGVMIQTDASTQPIELRGRRD
ncbi:hypothetical protein JI600_000954 [Vibrio parahaemolyticus]|nr:hypothetical protein [Vibrio parahaemolyticus]EGY8740900.1 hypothetical protein [Vibrio parahaemolyticus]EHE6933626.1 hypothetical protein [Vibrio parahaemolyticus]